VSSRQQKRNHKRREKKKVRRNQNDLKGSIRKLEFIQYMMHYESKLSIIQGFIQKKFGDEFTEYVENLSKEKEEIIEQTEEKEEIIEQTEETEKSVFEETEDQTNNEEEVSGNQ